MAAGNPSCSISSCSNPSCLNPLMKLSKGMKGLDMVVLLAEGIARAEVYLFGGQVLSWQHVCCGEILFVSKKAIFQPSKAIRGGIPIYFPQFEIYRTLELHDFIRKRTWSIDTNPPPFPANEVCESFVDLILRPSDGDLKIWPHSFEFRLRVGLAPGGELMLTSRIRNVNTNGKPFSFTFAFQNHFSVPDIGEVRVEGLETLHYLDNLKAKECFTEQGDGITFETEVDRMYLSTPPKIAILDHERRRTFVLRKDGLPDAVVWNPWDKRAKALADFGNDEYNRMLCVGAAAIEKPITLRPGEEWTGRQELSVVQSSYFSGPLDRQKVLQG